MASELATGYIQILPSMGGVKTTIEKELGGAGESAGRKSGNLFGSMMSKAVVASSAALGTAVFKSLTGGAELQQALGGVETLYKTHADKVINYANEAWKNAGITANDYMEQSTSFAAALIQSLDGDTSKAASAANMAINDMADNAAKMGTPIENLMIAYQGFSRNQYLLLDNLKIGYGGTKTEMERLLQDAEKLTGIEYDINNLADVYNAIHVIQENLGLTGVAADEAKTTLSGSFNAMKAAATDFLSNLSMRPELVQKSLMNLIGAVKTFGVDNLIPAIGNIIQSIPVVIGQFMQGDFIGQLFNMLGDMSGKLLNGATSFINLGLGLIMKLADGIAMGLPSIIQNVPTIVTNIANIINNNAPKLIGVGLYIIKTLGIGLIKAVPSLIGNIPRILKAIMTAFMAFSWANLGRSVLAGMKSSMVGPVQKGLKGVIQTIKGKASSIISEFKAPFTRAAESIRSIVGRIRGMFPLSIGNIFSNLRLPRLTVTGGKAPFGIGGLGSLPKFNIKWNAEGGIFDSSSIIGYGVGEAGREAILPLDRNTGWMDDIARRISNGGGTVNVVMNLDGKMIGQASVDYINGQTIVFGANPLIV